MKLPLFYGWILVSVAWLCYGFGISPAYYSWSIFTDFVQKELEFDRGQLGMIFGTFIILYSCVGPLVGMAQHRWGIRKTMAGGFVVTSIGFFLLSGAHTFWEFIAYFSILGGSGIGFATILPCQTLGQNWFLKRRALAIAIIFTSGGIVAKLVARADTFILEEYTWRTGWQAIAAVSAVLAVLAALLVRDTPEQLGQLRDGAVPGNDEGQPITALNHSADWSPSAALKTPQFVLLVVCACACAVPWGVATSNMKLFFLDMGFEGAVASSFLGMMAFISIFGRLIGFLADYIPPQLVLGLSLLIEAIGMAGLLVADTKPVAYLYITLIGLGFGTAYISTPVVFSHFLGRRAFGMTAGVRLFIVGIFNGLGPPIAGELFDRTGSYTIAFLGLAGLGLIGVVCAALLRHPGPPTDISAPG